MHPKLKDYKVHPVAAMFPMLDEKSPDWGKFVDSIATCGQLEPIIVDGDVLLDGRNRLRACQQLGIEPKLKEWASLGVNPSQMVWILALNMDRRHLTSEQKVMITTDALRWEVEQITATERQKSAFEKGASPNPGGKLKAEADPKSGPPERDTKKKHANSTAGRIADIAKVSRYKAEQAIKVDKAVERGELPPEVRERVKAGTMELHEAVKAIPAEKKSRPRKSLRDRVVGDVNKLLGKYEKSEQSSVKQIIVELIA